jgi:hypothetical protein
MKTVRNGSGIIGVLDHRAEATVLMRSLRAEPHPLNHITLNLVEK